MSTQTIAGAEAVVDIDGQEAGWVTNYRVSESIERFPVERLGNIDAEEHVATRRRVNFSFGTLKIRRLALTQRGIYPRGDTEAVLNFPASTIVLRSVVDPTLAVCTLSRASFEGRSIDVSSSSVMMEEVNGVAIRLLDEDGL